MTDMIEDRVWDVDDLPRSRRIALKHDLASRIVCDDRRHRGQVRSGIGVTLLAAAVTAAAMWTFTPQAIASWSAVPIPLSIALNDPMVQQCLEDMPTGLSEQVPRAELVPVVAEKRGTSRAALLSDEDSQAICITVGKSRTAGRTLSPALATGQNVSLTGNGGSTDADSGDRYVYGRVSPRAVMVEIVTTTGLHVTASVARSCYLAWWPGGAAPATITAEDANHQVITTIRPESR